jgi:hypothetical protein
MLITRRLLLMMGLALAFSACDDSQGPGEPAAEDVSVLTRNVYLGTDLDPLLATTDPSALPAIAAQEYANVEATDFRERAGALAREIADATPHLVGLQEVGLYRLQSPGDAAQGGGTPAIDTSYDFLGLLLDSLAARGLAYSVAVAHEGVDEELPALIGGPPLTDLRFTDREVILARSDVNISQPLGADFTTAAAYSTGGGTVTLIRGYVSVLATVGEQTFRFVSTHLQGQDAPLVQRDQADELLGVLEGETVPVILVGDFNSAADGSQTPTYGSVVQAGYLDAWARAHAAEPGFTCCFDPDLRGMSRTLDQRLDVVFVSEGIAVLRAELLGEAPEDRTGSGLRPSDHAGVVATLRVGGGAT